VFSALRSCVTQDDERNVLVELEKAEAPVVLASDTVESHRRATYVVTNRIEQAGGNLTHPGRTSGLRTRLAAVPVRDRVVLVWPDLDLSEADLSTIDRLAFRVPYLGRSTSIVLVTARRSAANDTMPEGLSTYVSSPRAGSDLRLRTPYPGCLDELENLYDEGQPAWLAFPESRMVGYRLQRAQTDPQPPTPSRYTDFVILRFAGVRFDGRLTAVFTEALRRLVMSRTRNPLPAALHGHERDASPHVAFLAVPNVGGPHSDGHLMGLAVAIPELPRADLRAIVAGVLPPYGSDDPLTLRVPRIGEVELRYEPGAVRPWGVNPERWRRGSRTWMSATPMVLDRYPKRGDVESEIARSCEFAGFPTPVDITFSTQPLVEGGVRMTPRDLPEAVRGRLFRHVAITFPSTVAGPVLLGSGRYLGVGLFAPATSTSTEAA
jgi:CRISPR-associated protein Csb2